MAETIHDAEAQLKKLHPFFSGSTAVTPPTPDSSCYGPASDESKNDPIEPGEHGELGERQPKRRKTDPSSRILETLPKAPRAKRRPRVSEVPGIMKHFGQPATSNQHPNIEQILDEGGVRMLPSRGADLRSSEAGTLGTESNRDSLGSEDSHNSAQPVYAQISKKVLRFNPSTGTLGSPPPSEPQAPALAPAPISKPGKKRGRKPKAFLVTVGYRRNPIFSDRVGRMINEVLTGTSRIYPCVPTIATPKTPPPSYDGTNDKASKATNPKETTPKKVAMPNKPAHPFFQAKGKTVSSTDEDGTKMKKEKASVKRQVIFTSTPCSPKRPRPAPPSSSLSISASRQAGMKIPGAQHPAWPWRDMVHIRAHSPLDTASDARRQENPISRRGRKAKGQTVLVSDRESILYEGASRLGIHQILNDLRSTNDEDFRPIAPILRVPIKHFESGRRLQTRIFKELRTLRNRTASVNTHPAIACAYESIATALSAFDMSTCESIAWTQKYAPTSARCILQNGREAELLRDWLQTLKVQAVDTGISDNNPKPKNISAPRKKRRHKKLEGFVVSSDEEANEMDELPDDEPEWLLPDGRGDAKKTVVRSGDATNRGGKLNTRLANAVLLSGPHGCGKTAAVYAIAKELDFEVFEINAGARRSGKDILERVGDMTRNHLVNHQQKDDLRVDEALEDGVAQELKSEKQGMMTSFFKPKSSLPSKGPQKVDQRSEPLVVVSQEKKPNRDQKQSLILLEEVDILYEEDKQFWATVITMIAQSKRPFIMTCNNESVVPLQNLKLHGIFRLSPPPTDLAVDMLLLIAANEGHALERHTVEDLYHSRKHDLRAAITELNYWCQIGVGDLRGGFDWFYPRWPKGSDVDQEGQTIRVVSQAAYHAGMGWLNRDLTTMESSSLPSVVPALHREVWDHWGLDVSDHHDFRDSLRWVEAAAKPPCSRATRMEALLSIEAFTESMSDSDICGPFLSPLSNHISLDPTVPNLHTKILDDFTIGNKVLDVTPLSHYDSISLGASTSLRILAQSKLVNGQLPHERLSSMQCFDEKRITGDLKHHFTTSFQAENPINRRDYSIAFDPIAASEKILANGYLDPSVFDREMTPLCLDVAPYVRSIVSYDQRLSKERRTRSNLLSEGGEPEKKRMRTTRAALSALEGGSRATIRRERYFSADINPHLVMRTGGKCWGELAYQVDTPETSDSTAPGNYDIDTAAA